MSYDRDYMEVAKRLITKPATVDRTGVGRKKAVGCNLLIERPDLHFPLLLSKKVFTESVFKELLWFLRGETNINTLDCGIWDKWAKEDGDIGPLYGKQWRSWPDVQLVDARSPTAKQRGVELLNRGYVYKGVCFDKMHAIEHQVYRKEWDQIARIEQELAKHNGSSRMVCNAWNVGSLDDMVLSPCHFAWQLIVSEPTDEERKMNDFYGIETFEHTLHMSVYQRSADWLVGAPFNIASYSALLLMFAQVHKYNVGDLSYNPGDAHIYQNQVEAFSQQLAQYEALSETAEYPNLYLEERGQKSVLDFVLDDFIVDNYNPAAVVKYPVS